MHLFLRLYVDNVDVLALICGGNHPVALIAGLFILGMKPELLAVLKLNSPFSVRPGPGPAASLLESAVVCLSPSVLIIDHSVCEGGVYCSP